MPSPLLSIEDLRVHYPVAGERLGRGRRLARAVDGVTCQVSAGETLGLVGESGCGKTSLGRAVVRLVHRTGGRIRFLGDEIARLEGWELLQYRRRVQMIFQDPAGSLNPRMTIETSLAEPLTIHGLRLSRSDRRDRVIDLLGAVGLSPDLLNRYPHELSGGQRQRIGLARALAVEPKLIVCDEPVSALDVSVQARVVNLLRDLQNERNLAYLFIAHDLAVVGHLSHRIAVMYLGRLVEVGPARLIIEQARHPYTQALLSAVPEMGHSRSVARQTLKGEPPSPLAPPTGCAFHPRCPRAEARCRTERPLPRMIAPGHDVACHFT